MFVKSCLSIILSIFFIVSSVTAANNTFIKNFGKWNVSTNWQSNHIPGKEETVVISDGRVALISSGRNKCGIIYCGLSSKTHQKWGRIVLKKGGSLDASVLSLGKNKNNRGIMMVAGGNLLITKNLYVGDGERKTAGRGELFLSAGNLKMENDAPAFIGYKGKGEMIIAWQGKMKANDISIAELPGSQGSSLKIVGGELMANNIKVNWQNPTIPSKAIISGGKVVWNNQFIVNDVLEIQNSSADIKCNNKNGAGLLLNDTSTLKFEFGAKGIAPINLKKSKINISSNSKLEISATYYTSANGKPGSFLLIKHNGYANEKTFSKVKLTGFGNLIPKLIYKKDSIFLELKEKDKIVDRSNQGVLMKYWQLPIDADMDKTVIFPPLTYMPDFSNSLVESHPIFGKGVRKIDLSEAWRQTNILIQFKGLINIPKNGKYTFRIKYNEAARLTIDGSSVGKDKPGESTLTLNLTNGMHNIEVGYYQNDSAGKLEVSWEGPGFSKEEIPEDAYFIPAPPKGFTRYYGFGNIMPDDERIYNYCPSFMFDENEGLYKIWSGGAGDGDFILYKEAPTLDKLLSCPTLNQLHPLHDDKFDEIHCCDPNTFEDKNGTFYLTYSGCSDGKPLGKATRIGMAISHDRGRSWKRLHNGEHIIGPDQPEGGYGTGQSAVVRANDGYYYMIYTDADAAHKGRGLAVIKCSDPSFPTNKFTFVKNKLHYGASVDLAYDSEKDEFIIVSQASSDPDKTPDPYAGVRLAYFDKSWVEIRKVYLKANTYWSFGEGVSFLTDLKKNPVKYSYHENEAYVFAAATQSCEADTRLWAEWVEGDTKYLMFHIPDELTEDASK
ncbi:hypothetical protein KAH27_06640 [bacterium]|nr:hypothetical protein [bacterium]